MAEPVALWAVSDGKLTRLTSRPVDRERRLEDWIESNPDILGERLLLVGRQVQTAYGGVVDLLAIDGEGRGVVIELKRGRTPREIVSQALDYASWLEQLTDADLRDRTARTSGQSFGEAYQRLFRASPPPQLNQEQRVLIVSTDVDEATGRIVGYLTRRYGVNINVVTLAYFVVGEHELLARTWVVDPAELEERAVDTRREEELTFDEASKWTGYWHVNIGALADIGIRRSWEDERRYGFLSAGQGAKWRDEISRLPIGARVYAYLNGAGYVGGGEIVSSATQANVFVPPGSDRPLRELPLESPDWFLNADDPEMAEYMVGVNWTKTVDRTQGVRVPSALRGTVRKIRNADVAQMLHETFG